MEVRIAHGDEVSGASFGAKIESGARVRASPLETIDEPSPTIEKYVPRDVMFGGETSRRLAVSLASQNLKLRIARGRQLAQHVPDPSLRHALLALMKDMDVEVATLSPELADAPAM